MINIADLPAVRAQLERAAVTEDEKLAQPEVTAGQGRPQRRMVLDGGKYYVNEVTDKPK